jgi:hypothetical protein
MASSEDLAFFAALYVTYIRNVKDAPAYPSGRAGRAALGLTGAAQVFQPGLSARG